jgi:hypothetical protein
MRPYSPLLIVAALLMPAIAATAADRPATVLLITSKELAPAWQAFADWKTRIGKATKILTVDQITGQYKGRDVQEKIRAAVLDHAQTRQTRWVILGGDSLPDGKGHVPDRDTPHRIMGGRLAYRDIPTDVYYISPKTWDANNDGIYGQWPQDREAIAYTHPKGVSIGRIPVRTSVDVAAYTKKIIAYESRYPESGFARKLVYTNTVDMSEKKVRQSWDRYISPAWSGGDVIRFFHTSTPWDKTKAGDYPLSPANWTKLINQKTAGKMHMHGHGFLPGWVLEDHGLASAKTIHTLTNRNAYLVMTTVSCFTGQYDDAKDPSITEAMLRKPDGGAVLILAPSREGVPIFHDPADFRLMVLKGKLDGTTMTHTRFWKNGLSKKVTAGEAFMAAKAQMTDDAMRHAGYHWCQSEINLLGDPTLDLRADDPSTPKVTAPKAISKGKQRVVVKTRSGLTVCLWKGQEVYAVDVANADGEASFAISPTTAGPMLLSVTGPSVNVYTGQIEIQ